MKATAHVCVFTTALMFAGQAFPATDLDKPIEQTKPTIRTEIYRGAQALGVCGGGIHIAFECVYGIQNKNVQQNTATDAFNVGLFFGAWLASEIVERAAMQSSGRVAKTDAMLYFKKMKEYQAKLRIDNAALCEATRVICKNVLPDMAEWESKLKAQ
jgi:hypothetical protein